MHDAWAPYDTYDKAAHALCNAHVLRELQAVTDLAPEGQWCWAAQATDALREMNNLVNTVHATDDAGAKEFCSIRTYTATAAKHGVPLLGALTRLTEGRPWLPEAA